MASKQETADFILDQLSGAGDLSARKMFGEYGIFLGQKMVAVVCDDQLFVKLTAKGQAFAGDIELAPPFPGAKMYMLVQDKLDERDWLAQLIRITAAELPPPKKKKPKKS